MTLKRRVDNDTQRYLPVAPARCLYRYAFAVVFFLLVVVDVVSTYHYIIKLNPKLNSGSNKNAIAVYAGALTDARSEHCGVNVK